MALTQVIGSGIGQVTDIKLGGSGAANTLDDYEEGTWTISFPMSTSGSYTVRAGYTSGYYTKIGNLVSVFARFEALGESSPSGEIRIAGFPFNFINTVPSGGALSMAFPILFRGYASSSNNMGVFAQATHGTNYATFKMQKSDTDYGYAGVTPSDVTNFEGSLNFSYLTE